MRFSIRYKILIVLGVLLLSAVAFYTALASFIFSEQKTALLYDLNHSIAVNIAAQLRSQLFQTKNQLRLFAVSNMITGQSQLKLPADYLKSSRILAVDFFKKENNLFLKQRLDSSVPSLGSGLKEIEPWLNEAMAKEMAFWKKPQSSEISRFLVATKVDIAIDKSPYTYVIVAELDGKSLLETLQSANIFHSYLARQSGEVVVHYDRSTLAAPDDIKGHPLLAKASAESATSGVSAFSWGGQQWYGAYAPVGMAGLIFVSQASRSEVTSAITTLIERSVLFGIIIVTVTFIASILFSKRLTRNLSILTSSARKIQGGDLESKIEIRSRDEIEELASSFNAMMDSLKASREEIERYNRELEEKVALRTSQLRETNAMIKEVQEKLLKATQLAAIGEVAGRTAHELLNPLTAIISRLERSRNVVTTSGGGPEAQGSLPAQLSEIVSAWESDYRKGGFPALLSALQQKSTVKPELSLLDEDLDNLKKLAHFWTRQTEVLSSDLEFVHEQSQRIHRIIDRMRELARSSVKSDVHCHKAIEEALLTMADFLKKRGVNLAPDLKAASDLAHLNQDEFIQIITNLIRNALHAVESVKDPAKRQQGKITVSTHSENHLFLVDVIDNGIGIPDLHRGKIFEQGFTTKAPSEGTGLGLAICRRYAHAFGGEVELLYSEPDGRGTCFRVTAPLVSSKAESKMAS